MLGHGPDREAKMARLVADTPLKRFDLPAEVAAMATMLAYLIRVPHGVFSLSTVLYLALT